MSAIFAPSFADSRSMRASSAMAASRVPTSGLVSCFPASAIRCPTGSATSVLPQAARPSVSASANALGASGRLFRGRGIVPLVERAEDALGARRRFLHLGGAAGGGEDIPRLLDVLVLKQH